jgi:hypothetical protein
MEVAVFVSKQAQASDLIGVSVRPTEHVDSDAIHSFLPSQFYRRTRKHTVSPYKQQAT